jgi:hypothetical protein
VFIRHLSVAVEVGIEPLQNGGKSAKEHLLGTLWILGIAEPNVDILFLAKLATRLRVFQGEASCVRLTFASSRDCSVQLASARSLSIFSRARASGLSAKEVIARDYNHKGIIRVKQPGTPVQVLPKNMSIQVVFDWRPNLDALKQRIRKPQDS